MGVKILAIETSCDDTGVAILEVKKPNSFGVLSDIVSSQIEVHKKYGGVFPAMAKREHQKNLVPTLEKSLKEAGLLKKGAKKSKLDYKNLETILVREPELFKQLAPFLEKYEKPKIDVISVINGPGLEPCLWVGVNFAKALSSHWKIPIVEVNHVKAHILINFMKHETWDIKQSFPAIALVVSGGHTQLILMKSLDRYELLGETRDDAAGECFDKCAKILGLGYPGGPVVSKLAEGIKPKNALPRPMIGSKDYDFSFSGLKTAVLYADRKIKNRDENYKKQMCAEVQQAIIDVLLKKTIKAARDFNVKTIILGGGVVSNKELRKQFSEKIGESMPETNLLIPEPRYCTDNGLMVAITGYFRARDKKFTEWQDLVAKANLRIL